MAKEQSDAERKEQIRKNTAEAMKRHGAQKKKSREDVNQAPPRAERKATEE
jgi:hypothetical protein